MFESDPQNPAVLHVNHVYCLDFHQFGDAEWAQLGAIYAALPGWQGYHGVPWWFGHDEGQPPHLLASVEPSALMVEGVLRESDWWAWDEAFRERAQVLPRFEVD